MDCESNQVLSGSLFPLPTFAPTLSRLNRTNCTRRDLRNTRAVSRTSALARTSQTGPSRICRLSKVNPTYLQLAWVISRRS